MTTPKTAKKCPKHHIIHALYLCPMCLEDRKPSATECAHCYHDSGVILTSHPAQAQHVCCHCGATKAIRMEPIGGSACPPPGHGKFAPWHTTRFG